jgi:hypothetical protein
MKPPIPAPAYAGLYVLLCEIAREHGYALAIHGTMANDLDVIAIPWTDEAIPAKELAWAFFDKLHWMHHRALPDDFYEIELKPHGRQAWKIPLFPGPACVDLSIMPRSFK